MKAAIKGKRHGAGITSLVSVASTMIALNISDPAIREGIPNANALAVTTGLPYETCRKLWRGTATRIDLKTIERLCDVLRVRPGQLFDYEYEPDKPRSKRKTARGK
jgi:DNA-binding Xre family transcriptional regulator